jgi:ABC-type phosphate transport system substrate-binding protein
MRPPAPLLFAAALSALAGFAVAPAATPDPGAAIAVIVAPAHPRHLALEELALIYRRKKLFWNEGTRVNPVNLQPTHAVRRAFSSAVLGSTPEELQPYWNDMYFHGVSPPFVLSSEEAVIRFVAQTPGAIGYVSYCSADARVSVALVISNGRASGDGAGLACPK